MSELAPFTPNKIIPVTDTSKNTTESTPVILLFLPSPFLIVPLYHPQCVVIWNIAATKNLSSTYKCNFLGADNKQ